MAVRIGIDLGGTKIEGVALDGSEEIARLRVETPRDSYAATLEAIVGLVARLEEAPPRIPLDFARGKPSPPRLRSGQAESPSTSLGASRVPTVGIGIPGAIEPSTGLVKNANSTWLIGQPLLEDLQSRLGRPVRIANDANCFAMSEAADGAGAGSEIVFGVIVGTGTGAGIVVRGHLIAGVNAIAGEWGHNPLPWAEDEEVPGPPCYCGRRGCIETFLSGPGMAADHGRRTGERLTARAIVERAARGDAGARETMARYEGRMARALASIINVLDPDVIVLGGGMSNIERLYENVPRLWGPFVFAAEDQPRIPLDAARGKPAPPRRRSGHAESGIPTRTPVRTRLVRARHGDASGVRGAAWLWEDNDR